jgi:SHS family lactate transporter-like MFS transporter
MSTPAIPSANPHGSRVEWNTPRTPGERRISAFVASLVGWTLDSFDFFLVVLSLEVIGRDFGQDVRQMAIALTATLALRPVGALVFGTLSDRFGRRPLMVLSLSGFALVELATGFANSLVQFVLIRSLFGLIMGGQWGLGVSLAMEEVPSRHRGVLSGLLQQGYSIGFLLALGAYFLIAPAHGWRPLFFFGCLPGLATAALVLLRVKETRVWQRTRQPNFLAIGRELAMSWRVFLYMMMLMMALHMSSHLTRDIYPTFLEKDWGIMGRERLLLTAVSMIGAILGGLTVGWISDRIGRRRAMIGAMALAVAVVPVWAFAHALPLLVLGVVLMQFCVQGAWGVVPAHVAELSPDSVRGTLPGFANQVGLVFSSLAVYLEAVAVKGRSGGLATSTPIILAFCFTVVMTMVGRERRGISFGRQDR